MNEKVKAGLKEVWSWIWIAFVVFAFKSTFIDTNHIPSGSMLPTMAIGDFIFVNKMAYGLKIPYSDQLEEPIYLTKFTPPERGDIIVFRYPGDPSILYVKRAVALPGDEIEVYNNELRINGKVVEATPAEKKEFIELYDKKFGPDNIQFYKQKIGKKNIVTARDESRGRYLNTQEIVTVPAGHVFVLGDNRDFSSDSRYWGFVPFKYIRGRAFFIWFNMVYPWSKEEFHFRPWRIGTILE